MLTIMRNLAARSVTALVYVSASAFAGSFIVTAASAATDNINVGVYYFPGWTNNIPDSPHPLPWKEIEKFPSRLPLIGKYNDGDPVVMRKQLNQMVSANIAFVMFDTYSLAHGALRATQSIDAYFKVAGTADPRFALMWDNSTDYIKSISDWDNLINNLVSRYLTDPRALRIEGMPVVKIYRAPGLTRRAAILGTSVSSLFARAQARARAAGLNGIFFIAGSWPRESSDEQLKADGYRAISAYNLAVPVSQQVQTKGYVTRDSGYRKYWAAYDKLSVLPVVLPLTVGWDRSPWGGSNQGHSFASPKQFSAHVSAALSILSKGNTEAARTAIICCWNEYGEGSILEPTVQFGDAYLRVLRDNLMVLQQAGEK